MLALPACGNSKWIVVFSLNGFGVFLNNKISFSEEISVTSVIAWISNKPSVEMISISSKSALYAIAGVMSELVDICVDVPVCPITLKVR